MAARYIRSAWLALTVSLTLSANSLAVAAGLDGHSGPDAQALARKRLAEATIQLKDRMEFCRKHQIIVPAGTFAQVDLTHGQLRTALSYFSVRASNRCIEEQAGNFVMASYMAQRAGIVSKDRTSSAKAPGLESLVLDSRWRELQLKAKYLVLPEDGRDQLGNIKELQEPFNLLKSAEVANLLQR